MIDFNQREETKAFWALSNEEKIKLFNTPCGEGYTCPDCETYHPFHSGPVTSGGMFSCFIGLDASGMWRNPDKCCGKNWWTYDMSIS